MQRLYEAYRSRGLVILAVNSENIAASAVDEFGRSMGLTFPLLLDPAQRVSGQYHVHGLPTTLLVDKQGRVASVDFGARDWSGQTARQLVDAALAEG